MKPAYYFHRGKHIGLTWYADSEPAIKLASAARIAATSARTGIVDNLRRALRGDSPLPAHKGNLERAARGEPLSGPKVEAFRLALLGDLTAIPVDVWMFRAYRWTNETMSARKDVERRVRIGASRMKCAPRDYAASIWCGILLHHGREPLHYGQALHRLTAQQEAF